MTNSRHPEYESGRNLDICYLCGALPSEKKILSASVNPTSEETKEIKLCENCSGIHKLSLLCVSERENIKENERYISELQVSRRKESRFRERIYEKISESENLEFEEQDLINSTAEEIGISPTTARRYLDKMCSSAGVLTRYDNGDNTFVRFTLTRDDFQ